MIELAARGVQHMLEADQGGLVELAAGALAGRRPNGTGARDRQPQLAFAELAAERPDLTAVECEGERATYGELAARSGAIARELRDLGVGPDVVVGICLPRRVEAIAAVLGVLRAGGAYLPLDPAHPPERRRFMLEDAGARALIATPALAAQTGADGVAVVVPGETANAEPPPPPDWDAPADTDLAYVMYTSGSTGKPKGVMIEHASLAAFVGWGIHEFSADELRAVLASTSLGFDISIFEVLVPLAAGGRIVLVDNLFALRRDPHDGVTLINTVPSLMAGVLADATLPASVRTVILAGEPLTGQLADRVHDQPGVERVVNGYGPTEDTIYSTWAEVPRGVRPSIGRSLPGKRAFVLDEQLHPLPVGETGELCLAGVGVARGYRGRDELTRERFVEHDLGEGRPVRIYRTGDLARFEDDGSLTHLGRIDHQIKIHGVRIEPGEIEDTLARHEAVEQAAVLARERAGGDLRLVAYLVPGAGELPAGPELREFARQTLPETMVPSAFVALDELPLNANGKLDRAALPDPPATVTTAAPLSETERRLADIWVDLLALDTPIGPSDDFFELGGESLVAFEMFELIHEQFGCDLPENVIVEASTLRALAERIDAGTVGDRRLVRINPGAQRVPCMYVHAGAGGMFTLRRFSSRLGEDQPVFGVQAFRDAQIELGDLVSVEATAAECLDVLREVQPKGPYMLAGHSIGGHIAFDMACTLQAAGEEILFLGLMDPAAPHTQRQVGRFKARARELTGTGPEPRRKGLARSALAAARARVGPRDGDSGDTPTAAAAVDTNVQAWMDNLAHVERDYDPPDFRGDAVVYTTAEMARWTGSPTLGWERHVDGELARRRVPGDHLSMLLDPHARELARAMAADLRAAQATVGA